MAQYKMKGPTRDACLAKWADKDTEKKGKTDSTEIWCLTTRHRHQHHHHHHRYFVIRKTPQRRQ